MSRSLNCGKSSQASERKCPSESNLPYRSACEPPSLTRECLRQLGFLGVPKMAERVWSGVGWSSDRYRDPTFSGPPPGRRYS
jgi:hypothetical protein